jgi:hypothetical protein
VRDDVVYITFCLCTEYKLNGFIVFTSTDGLRCRPIANAHFGLATCALINS